MDVELRDVKVMKLFNKSTFNHRTLIKACGLALFLFHWQRYASEKLFVLSSSCAAHVPQRRMENAVKLMSYKSRSEDRNSSTGPHFTFSVRRSVEFYGDGEPGYCCAYKCVF